LFLQANLGMDNNYDFETMLNSLLNYSKTNTELFKLKFIYKTTKVVSAILFSVTTLILTLSFVLFLNVGIALWLNEYFGEVYYGFLIVALFYLFCALFIKVFCKKWFKLKISNYIIHQIFND